MFPRIRIVATLLILALLVATSLSAKTQEVEWAPEAHEAGLLEQLIEWVALHLSPMNPGQGSEHQTKIGSQLDPDGNH
jgi:hypothetical protein